MTRLLIVALLGIILAACAGTAPPTATPTPTVRPTRAPTPTAAPTAAPTALPSPTPAPTATPTPTPANLGSRATFVTFFESLGFEGGDSPLADGRPRWLARREADGSIVEAIGPPEAITEISLTVVASADAGTLAGEVLNLYAPGSVQFLQEVLSAAQIEDQDQSRRIAGRTVRVQTLAAADGLLVTISISAE